jgi:deoxyribodipyrimidine photolyase-like uncharacterized protein
MIMMDARFMREYVQAVEGRTGRPWNYDMLGIVKCKPWMSRLTQEYIVMMSSNCDIAIYDPWMCEWTFDLELCPSDMTAIYSEFIARHTLRELRTNLV